MTDLLAAEALSLRLRELAALRLSGLEPRCGLIVKRALTVQQLKLR